MIIEIEDHCQKFSGRFTLRQLWLKYPRITTFSQFRRMTAPLFQDGTIEENIEGRIVWIG